MKEEINILIVKHFEGEITSNEASILHEWRASSEENKVHFDQMSRLWNTSFHSFSPQDLDVASAEEKVLKRIRPTKSIYRNLLSWGQKIASVLFIPLAVLSAYLLIQQNDATPLETTSHEVFAMPGTRSKINLPDGSEVWLNSNSYMRYDTPFESGIREVMLSGEAFFSVNADKNNPFIITFEDMEVMVTGTELNVESYANDSINIVTLVNGKASILIADHKEITLLPNQQFIVDTRTNEYGLISKDAMSYTRWKDGVLIFREETLKDVFKRVGRTFHVEIDIMAPSLAEHLYRATFTDESLDQILDLISQSAPIHYEYIISPQGKKRIEVYLKNS